VPRNPAGKHIAKKYSQGILHDHRSKKPLYIVTQGVKEPFSIGVGEKNRPEIIKAGKIRAEKLFPTEKAVKKRDKKGQQDKYKNHRQTGKNKEKNPKTPADFFIPHTAPSSPEIREDSRRKENAPTWRFVTL
jgi:hypothetical protein